MTEATATKTKTKSTVAPFGIEADGRRNGDLLLRCLRGHRLRSRFVPTRAAKNPRTGEEYIPVDQARAFANWPTIPGQQLHVNPATCQWTITDPLLGDDELCEKIRRAMKRQGQAVGDRIGGVPTQKGVLDVHMMKSLCREMWHIVNTGDAKVVKGVLPSMEDVEAMDGDFLLDPGTRMNTSRPKFEKDLPEYVRNLGRLGT